MLEHEVLGEYERMLNGEEPSEKRHSPVEATTTSESSLEEVTEKHLSDTFWTS
jgi:hypothetical protein